ncbi:MAG: gliding motility-associated C-terminal domain-containing protein, partial [Bacteroidales bacterium]
KILKVNGNVSGSYLILKDIHGLGNATYDAMESYDKGNTNGWNFHPLTPLQLYWVNGKGRWDNPAHWSFSSGGPGGACIPRKVDDVFFDSLSFSSDSNKTVYGALNSSYIPGECHNMDWSGAKYNPVFSGGYHIYGSLTMIDSMDNQSVLGFLSDTSETIDFSGQSAQQINFYNGGTWELVDDMKSDHAINFFHGNLYTNGYTITAENFTSDVDSSRSLVLDTSDVFLSRKYLVKGKNFTLDAGSSNVYFVDTITTAPLEMELNGGSAPHFHNVTFIHRFGDSYLDIKSTEVHYDKLEFDSDTYIYGKTFSDSLLFYPGHTYRLDHTKKQRIYDYWLVRGNNCFPINLESTLKDYQAKVFKDGSDVQGDFINMRDIKAEGNATFYAGDFSDDISNNDNWIFSNGPSYVYGLPDTVYFQLGGSATLTTDNFNGGPNTQYLWSTGSTKDSIVVDSSGWYYITVTYAGNCVVEDSTYLACLLDIDFITKEITCHGGLDGYAEVILPDSSATYEFWWETGDTTQYVDNQPAGWISVDVLANGLCAVYDSTEIKEPPPIEVPLGDTAYCEDDSLLLDAGAQFVEYNWDDGYQQQTRLIWDPDTFVVAVMDIDSCWSAPDTFTVEEDTIPYFDLGPDTTLCLYETQTLKALAGCDAYLWSNGSTFPEITVDKVGTYSVQVWQGTCSYVDSITLSHCTPELIIPNVFTPNGDGYNDRFAPKSTNIYDFEMIIINRWGKEIFRTQDINQGWDGKINGSRASEGTYYYVIRYKNHGGQKHNVLQSKSGAVTLLR